MFLENFHSLENWVEKFFKYAMFSIVMIQETVTFLHILINQLDFLLLWNFGSHKDIDYTFAI